MRIKDLAQKTVISAGVDTVINDPTISITIWPDTDLSVTAQGATHIMGDCRSHIHISVRHDGTPAQIEAAIKRAIKALSSAQ
jgi:hypothetical protein